MRWLVSAVVYVLLTCAVLAQVGQIPTYSPVHTGGGGGNVTPDPAGPGTQKYQASSNSFTYTGYTVPGGLTNPGLVCWLTRADGSNDVRTGVAISWGAQSMALRKIQDDGGAGASAVWLFGLRAPTSGTQTLTVSATNTARDNMVNCTAFSNVNQTSDAAAFPNPTGTNTAASIAVTSAAGHVAVGVFENGSNSGTIIPTIALDDHTNGAIINAAGDYVASSGASTTVGTTTIQGDIAGMDISN